MMMVVQRLSSVKSGMINDSRAICGMIISRENWQRIPTPVPPRPTQIIHELTWNEIWAIGWEACDCIGIAQPVISSVHSM
jgi:hypothetical protein